jgi:endonuclease III
MDMRHSRVDHASMDAKLPFDIDRAMRLIREAVQPFPKAALFALADEGYSTAFELLVACIISIRTYDEVTMVAARRLFGIARTAGEMSGLSAERIDGAIGASTFHEAKARQIREIGRRVVAEHGGELPCQEEVLLSFAGVGPKCANLVLGIACGDAKIGVDVHVHRVTNRWGYVAASTPERTMLALEETLPKRYWVEINRLLVPFGKHVCTGRLPRCSTCPVLDMCRQAGVAAHR